MNVINHLIMSPIKPTLIQTSFFWGLHYYNVVFSVIFRLSQQKPDRTRAKIFLKLTSDKFSRSKIKNNFDSSDRIIKKRTESICDLTCL